MYFGPAVREGLIMGSRTLVLAMGLLWVTSVFAQDFTSFQTGDELFDTCNDQADGPRHAVCAGYVAGASDVLNSQGIICTPTEVSVQQTVDVIVSFLQVNPAQRHMAAPVLIGAALGNAFPCK